MSPLVIQRNQTRDRNLVESTKLEKITLDSKTLRRNEKKEKNERRKHKKEKSHKNSSKLVTTKSISDESDQLEKSGLTEELEEPHNNLGYLSDGSQTSKKRRRDDSPPPPPVESLVKAVHVAGNPLRIRLIFKKPKVDSPSLSIEDLPVCSASGTESLIRREPVVLSSVPCVKVSEPEENLSSASVAAVAETKKIKKHKPSREDRYNALFDDWTPPSSSILAKEVDSYSNDDDDDWLFGNRTQEKCEAVVKIDEDTNMCLNGTSDSSWPRARFLSEVGIYSLPYTVPF